MDSLRRRVPAQDIRGTDAVMLEVMMSDLCEKPLGQLAPANIADLFALAELSTAPHAIARRVVGFPRRIAAEIADLPNGAELLALVEELKAVPADRVPQTLRGVWQEEAVRPKRPAAERAAITAMLDRWAEVAPEPFVIAAPAPAVRPGVPARGAGQPVVRNLPMAPPQHKEERRARTPAGAREPRTAVSRPKPEEDPARSAWLREIILDRLVDAADRGLLEAVVVGAVKHRARDIYPNLAPPEILASLRELEKRGEVRHTAGRYIRQLGRR